MNNDSAISTLCLNGEFMDGVLHQYILGNGYRAYNPALQRFTSPDSMSPFGAGGINPYIYCEGDPISNTDPTGHMIPGKPVKRVVHVSEAMEMSSHKGTDMALAAQETAEGDTAVSSSAELNGTAMNGRCTESAFTERSDMEQQFNRAEPRGSVGRPRVNNSALITEQSGAQKNLDILFHIAAPRESGGRPRVNNSVVLPVQRGARDDQNRLSHIAAPRGSVGRPWANNSALITEQPGVRDDLEQLFGPAGPIRPSVVRPNSDPIVYRI